MDLETPHGPAAADVDAVTAPRFLLVLTHGAGGGVDSADLLAVRDEAVALGGTVARLLQPYRVAGRKMPGANTGTQDAAFVAAVRGLTERYGADVPLVTGGRSNGARVACRTAGELGVRAVVALAFPLHPPGRPERSRAEELRASGVDTLVVNGDRDPFGVPDAADATRLVVLPGEGHALSKNPGAVASVVGDWLGGLLKITRTG
ncbi:MAG: alpha/beta hydrolase [Streptosporangiales bacterium]|nr:alpha/beta hydrolase [Streptosporangiales bacterium]